MGGLHCEEAENAVLGAVLIDSAVLESVAQLLSPSDFYSERAGLIFEAMLGLQADGQPIDRLTLRARLGGDRFDCLGGIAYLAGLDLDLPDISHVGTYANVVKSRSVRRQAVAAAEHHARALSNGDVADSQVAEAIARAADDLARLGRAGSPAADLTSVTLDHLLTLDLPRPQWLAEGLLRVGDLAMLHGPRGCGKTQFVCGLAVALTEGDMFLRYDVPEPAGVLLVDGEMGLADLVDRYRGLVRDRPRLAPFRILTADRPDLPGRPTLPPITTASGQALIERELARLGDVPRLLVLDNLSSLMGETPASENESESWSELQGWLISLRRSGATVLFVHHDGKGGAQRGTSKREDVLDLSLHLRRPDDYAPHEGARFEVHVSKGRHLHGAAARPYEARLETDANGRPIWTVKPLDSGGKYADAVRDCLDRGITGTKAVARELGVNPGTISRTLKLIKKVPDDAEN